MALPSVWLVAARVVRRVTVLCAALLVAPWWRLCWGAAKLSRWDGGGVVDLVGGEGNVRRVLAGGLVDAVVGHASVDDNGGVIGFLGSPVMPPARDDGVRGARLVRNRDGGRVEVVRCGGRVEVVRCGWACGEYEWAR